MPVGNALGGPNRFAEFLPDTDSMAERAHSPVAGLLILTVASAFGGLLAWSALAEVEQVVQATGKVEPAARVKIVNHPDGGRIAEVHVSEGQTVSAGEPLITFDPELSRTDLADLQGRWQLRSAEAARLEAEASGEPPAFDLLLVEERPDLVRGQTALLEERREAQRSRRTTLEEAVRQREAELGSLRADQARLGAGHKLLREQVDSAQQLAEKGLYPRMKLVDIQRLLSNIAGEMAEGRERLHAAEAALGEARSRRAGLDREWRSDVLAELAAARAEVSRLGGALTRQQAVLRHLVVRAPVDGIVQDLEVSSGGQSVGSNQPLLKVVPTGGALVVEARVANEDIGDVRVGQPARIKVLAYDFLHYGTLDGWIERVAADATPDPDTGALTYQVAVHTREAGRAGRFGIVPGMAVEVDLLAGERTVLSYLTDRILRLKEGAFRQG